MDETRATRRRALLAAGAGLLLAPEAAAHGGGNGGGGGEGGGGGLPYDIGKAFGPPDWYGPPGFDPPEPGGGIAGGTTSLPPLTPQEQAEWEATKAGLEGNVWATLEQIARGLDWLGSWAQYGLNFVPGLSGTNTGLTGGRAFAEAYGKAIDRGASQIEAIKEGLVAGAIGAGLDHLAGKAFGKATDGMFKSAKDAMNTMKQIGGPTPKGISKMIPNGVGYVVTVAGIEKGKELAHPVLVSTADQIGSALAKGVPNQSPPGGGGWLPGHTSPVPAAR